MRSHSLLPRLLLGGILVVVGAVIGGIIQSRDTTEPNEPVYTRTLTYSGRDWAPSASPDGKMIAFVSERGDGRARIWLRQIIGGTEAPLTDGPDDLPEFSPDGSSVLFIRNDGPDYSAYRIPVLGGQPRKMIQGAIEATWSPDGTQIAFLRSSDDQDSEDSRLAVTKTGSGESRELLTVSSPLRLAGR